MSAEASIGLRVYPLVKLEGMCHAQSDIAERRGCHVRLEQVIGHRMRERREEMALTQEQAGHRIGELLGRPWPRQAVSAAEKGDRAFTAAELVAIAFALDTNVSWLLTPLAGGLGVEMPSGAAVDQAKLIAAVLPRPGDGGDTDAVRQILVDLGQKIMENARAFDHLMDDVRTLYGFVMQPSGSSLRMDPVGNEVDITAMDPHALVRDTWVQTEDDDQ
jgi:transcriptional regulator with XRE-family HTH domain